MVELEKDHVLSDVERQLVTDALEAVLATDKFEAAPQMSAFLRYVVEQAANGNQSRIKAFTVAVDALGKPDSFDPQNDPVVRVLAGRLRAALSAYNKEHPHASMIITMTPGSYVPTFTRQATRPLGADVSSQTAGKARYSDQHEQQRPAGRRSAAAAQRSETCNLDTDLVCSGGALQEPSKVAALENTNGTRQSTVAVNDDLKPGTGSHPDRHSGQYSGGLLIRKFYSLLTVPKALLTCAIIAALVWVGMARNVQNSDATPGIMAATPVPGTEASPSTTTQAAPPSTIRPRPETPSVFVSAIDQGSSLENSLNAVVSSALSESDQVQVYRILNSDSNIRFWPEDYVLTMTALDLPDEKRVNMQLMEADSGRIIHSSSVALDEQADEQLTQTELDQLMDAAKSMVSKTGPLLEHYNARQ